MRRAYLALFALAATLPLGVVAAVNFIVDTKGVYAGESRGRAVSVYVDALLASPAGLVVSPYERPIKLELARRAPVDCAVTGSSHEMQAGIDVLPPARQRCRALVNLAVSGGGYEDLITQLGVLADRGDIRTLYVGVAPWLLRRGADIRWSDLSREYQAARQRLELPAVDTGSALAERLANLVNGRYFLRNLEHVQKVGWRRPKDVLKAAQADFANIAADEALTMPDGSHRYSRSYLATKPPPPSALSDGGYKIAQPYVEPAVMRELEAALSVFVRRGVHVTFVLSPYHPAVMSCGNPRVCSAFGEVEDAVAALSRRLGGDVLGGYDGRRFGLTNDDFYDEMHLARAAFLRLR